MTIYPDIIIDQQKIRTGYETLLSQWDWELHITLSYFRRVDYGYVCRDAKILLNEARRKMSCVKFAGILIYSNYLGDNPHVHILLTSDKNFNNTLSDFDLINKTRDLRNRKHLGWIESDFEIWKGNEATCKVTRGWSNEVICKYMAKSKNITLWDADRWDIERYRPKLLDRLIVRPCQETLLWEPEP